MRVTVFASASPETPAEYLAVAEQMGELLAENGDLCVNGGGALGCMGALNRAGVALTVLKTSFDDASLLWCCAYHPE